MSTPNTQVSNTDKGVQISFAPEHPEEGSEHHEEESGLPVTPRDFVGLVCQCKNLNWSDPLNNGGICDYTYIDGSRHYQMKPHPTLGLPCCDKVNLRQVPLEEYKQVCKYQLMTPTCCDLPEDVRDDLATFLNRGGGEGAIMMNDWIHRTPIITRNITVVSKKCLMPKMKNLKKRLICVKIWISVI